MYFLDCLLFLFYVEQNMGKRDMCSGLNRLLYSRVVTLCLPQVALNYFTVPSK